MDIKKKFEKGEKNNSYQRIDNNYFVNIFLGYNEEGLMSMVITEIGKEVLVKSSRIINVNLKKRKDKKMALSFDLVDETYKSMFLIFCKDIILNCEKVGNDKAILQAIKRWKYWREMFGEKKNTLLDKNQIKGLIGELIELKDNFMKNYDELISIESWMGPMYGHKDFEINNTWYEVKTLNETSIEVCINSFEQLESEDEGHLVVVRLEETTSVNNNSFNLNNIVNQIIDSIKEPSTLEIFIKKLDNVGYTVDSEYDKYNFLYKSTQRYLVNNFFPRLRRINFAPSIGNIKYTILLNGIHEFLEE